MPVFKISMLIDLKDLNMSSISLQTANRPKIRRFTIRSFGIHAEAALLLLYIAQQHIAHSAFKTLFELTKVIELLLSQAPAVSFSTGKANNSTFLH
jgi:hypothetical protein